MFAQSILVINFKSVFHYVTEIKYDFWKKKRFRQKRNLANEKLVPVRKTE